MKPFSFEAVSRIKGSITLAGDKSIAHRAVILSSLARGTTVIDNFPNNLDCLYTLRALRKLGVRIKFLSAKKIRITGCGLYGLKKPRAAVFLGDSGTSIRLLLGVLAGQDFRTTLSADKSLSRRPMRRITRPLRLMGAQIKSPTKAGQEYPPLTIQGGNLKGITYRMPVASAQVKSAIILAGLYADGATRVIERMASRDHTERMLKAFRGRIKISKKAITIRKTDRLVSPGEIFVPGDISSASFLIVASIIIKGSSLAIKGVGINPTRCGTLQVLKRMGAKIKISRQRIFIKSAEPTGDIYARSSRLNGTRIKKKEIPSLIDELPILLVAASLAKGRSIFEGVGELRVKETDRVTSMVENLKKMGARIRIKHNGSREDIVIDGVKEFVLPKSRIKSYGDHRTAMSMIIAGLAAGGRGSILIDDVSCINKSFPEFLKVLKRLIR